MHRFLIAYRKLKINLDWIDDFDWLFEPSSGIDNPAWTDDEILCIYECLLMDSIQHLFDKRSAKKTIREIFLWLIRDDDNPFSFSKCCHYTGVEPSELRDQLLWRLRKQGLSCIIPTLH